MTASDTHPVAAARVAAGALILDTEGRVLLVHPTYKDHWEIPGGYVEPGESPLAACRREIREELAMSPVIGRLLVVDWAPADGEGDKLLFIFDAVPIAPGERLQPVGDEIAGYSFVRPNELAKHVPDRLARRIRTAITARSRGKATYAEHGTEVS